MTQATSRKQLSSDAAQQKIAYVMSRFPKLTETFILYEMQAMERLGVEVEVYPLLRARNTSSHPEGASLLRKVIELAKPPAENAVMHADAEAYTRKAHYLPFISWPILLAQIWFVTHRPRAYFKTLWTLVRANLGSPNFLVGSISIFPKCAYMARRMTADGITRIHAHFANHPAAAAYVIHQLAGIPYSFTGHGADLQVDQHMLKEKVEAADYVVTISDYNKRFILDHCGQQFRDRVHVVRCGVDTNVFNVPKRAKSHETRPFSMVCTGTLYEVKGHRYLVDACRILKQRGTQFECHFIGVGPLQDELEAQVKRADLEREIVFRGRLTRHEIANQLRRADVAVAPSIPTKSGRREGIPVVLMEAMASEVAVVASRISGIPELIDHQINGVLVPPGDSVALADALQFLHDHVDVRQRMGTAARAKICAEYDLVKNTSRLLELFTGSAIK